MIVKLREGDNTLMVTFKVSSIKAGRMQILRAFKKYTTSDHSFIEYGQRKYTASEIYSKF